jgi:hypothetical protein
MKVIEKQEDNRTIKIMIISHRFNNFPNIVCSGSKINDDDVFLAEIRKRLRDKKLK